MAYLASWLCKYFAPGQQGQQNQLVTALQTMTTVHVRPKYRDLQPTIFAQKSWHEATYLHVIMIVHISIL